MKTLFKLAALFSLYLSAGWLMSQTPVWFKVADQDQTVVSTASMTYRFGAAFNTPPIPGSGGTPCAIPAGCWTAPVTTPGPASVFANPAKLGNPIPNTRKELDLQETATEQVVTVDGVSVTVPATGGGTNCPVGQYWDIAGGVTGEQATIPAGTVYRVAPSTTCITAPAETIVALTGNLVVLVKPIPQVIPIKTGTVTNYVQVVADGPPPPPTVISIVSLSLTFNGVMMNCVAAPSAPGALICTLAE